MYSGGIADVHGVVANTGATPIHRLRLAVAVAQDSGGGSVRWRERGELSRVIPELRPGERVAVSTRVEVTGDGWLRLGFAGQYNEGMLFPRGERIRVVDPAMSALELVALVAALTGILAIATAALSAFSRACRKPRTMARAWLRLAGVCLGVAIIGWQLFDPSTGAFLQEGEWSKLIGTAADLRIALPPEDGPYQIQVAPVADRACYIAIEVRIESGKLDIAPPRVLNAADVHRARFLRAIPRAFIYPATPYP